MSGLTKDNTPPALFSMGNCRRWGVRAAGDIWRLCGLQPRADGGALAGVAAVRQLRGSLHCRHGCGLVWADVGVSSRNRAPYYTVNSFGVCTRRAINDHLPEHVLPVISVLRGAQFQRVNRTPGGGGGMELRMLPCAGIANALSEMMRTTDQANRSVVTDRILGHAMFRPGGRCQHHSDAADLVYRFQSA